MKFRRSFEIVKASWGVLRSDKELLWLPVISGICTAIVGASFLGAAFLAGSDTVDGYSLSIVSYALLFLAYLVLAYITIFFNTGLVWAANERLQGGNPTLAGALAAARARARVILPWAIVSATVSVVLQLIEEQVGFVGRIIVGLVGVAWSLVTFLVLPLVVLENVSVGKAIKRSASMFKKTWGENLIGQGGIGLVSFLAILAAAPVIFLLVITGLTPLIILAVVLGVIWLATVTIVTSALGVVFQTALYRYASTGDVSEGFTQDQIAGAFAPKKRKRSN